jgi:AcrR family transcriptional regulator
MARSPAGPRRKRRGAYHHGDLRRALVAEAARTIQARGLDSLTLRAVGDRLGVSRSALYRHFADKSALVGAVAEEGFRTLRLRLLEAWEAEGRGRAGFEGMSVAYVRFALTHPSHYRVMFGGSALVAAAPSPALTEEAGGAFQALVDAIVAQQAEGLVRPDDPLDLAHYIWAIVHGIAMLAIDGKLGRHPPGADGLVRFAAERIRSGIALRV